MKTIILAGGQGSRLAEETKLMPKPMIRIGPRPILHHIMEHYASYGHNEFLVAAGYKAHVIKEYFLHYSALGSSFKVNLRSGMLHPVNQNTPDWNVTIHDTGLKSMTGGRLKRMEEFLDDEPFFLTYGDGLANIDLDALLDFHQSHGKLATVTAVHPVARFGEINLDETGLVTSFQEKPQIRTGWINGGFFVLQPDFLNLIDDDATILEKEPLEKATAQGELFAFMHDGFWQCMDTSRDRDTLNNFWESQPPPWTRKTS